MINSIEKLRQEMLLLMACDQQAGSTPPSTGEAARMLAASYTIRLAEQLDVLPTMNLPMNVFDVRQLASVITTGTGEPVSVVEYLQPQHMFQGRCNWRTSAHIVNHDEFAKRHFIDPLLLGPLGECAAYVERLARKAYCEIFPQATEFASMFCKATAVTALEQALLVRAMQYQAAANMRDFGAVLGVSPFMAREVADRSRVIVLTP